MEQYGLQVSMESSQLITKTKNTKRYIWISKTYRNITFSVAPATKTRRETSILEPIADSLNLNRKISLKRVR